MDRIPEPELMNDPAQALAYARADFEQPHNQFIEQFRGIFPDWPGTGYVLDLGCGPGDICRRFALAYPHCRIHGLDGAAAMLAVGRDDIHAAGLSDRIELFEAYLPVTTPPRAHYDAIICNSLLHHLRDPGVLWQAIQTYAMPGAPVFVMDLRRPVTQQQVADLVETYAADEPPVLRQDFQNSLFAAYQADEVKKQLRQADIDWLQVAEAGDRHLIVQGQRDKA